MKIDILLSFYNGDRYIDEQIESVFNQKGNLNTRLLIRNDGKYSKKLSYLDGDKIKVLQGGENLGVKLSFLELVKQSEDDCDYYAFCDQDDVWKNDKLAVATKTLEPYSSKPAMYFSKTILVDDNLNPIGIDSFENGVFNFERTLVKNNAIGCTIVFNKKLRDILISKLEGYIHISKSFLHDHLLYSLCLGVGGKVIFDEKAHIYYRQHEDNVIGNRKGTLKKIRANGLLNSNNERLDWAKEIYVNYSDDLTINNKNILETIISYKNNWSNRFRLMKNKRFSRIKIEEINIFLLFLLGKF